MIKIVSHTPRAKDAHAYTFPEKHQITITCQSGLESLVRRESEKIGLTDIIGQDRMITGSGELSTLYELLVRSRFANRVYLNLAEKKVTDFDSLHELARQIPWELYLSGKEQIIVEGSSTRSTLASAPTIQSVSQNAIFSTLTTPNSTSGIEVHILILIVDDVARVMLDITGEPLHKRGYREEAGDAPIKENLAAALIAFVGWKYRTPLLDPFCGSGTIAIEAAMLARDIAPGVNRRFRIESMKFHRREDLTSIRNIARMKAFPSGEYQIFASDIEPEMVAIAKRNAERAGVADDITFEVRDFLSSSLPPSTIVTNPPYGKRLEDEHLHEIYTKLEKIIESGGYITSMKRSPGNEWKNKKLLNGGDECRFWYQGKK